MAHGSRFLPSLMQLIAQRLEEQVESDEVSFHTCSYRELLDDWQSNGHDEVSAHAAAIRIDLPSASSGRACALLPGA